MIGMMWCNIHVIYKKNLTRKSSGNHKAKRIREAKT
jgi:hypothetical protein